MKTPERVVCTHLYPVLRKVNYLYLHDTPGNGASSLFFDAFYSYIRAFLISFTVLIQAEIEKPSLKMKESEASHLNVRSLNDIS